MELEKTVLRDWDGWYFQELSLRCAGGVTRGSSDTDLGIDFELQPLDGTPSVCANVLLFVSEWRREELQMLVFSHI